MIIPKPAPLALSEVLTTEDLARFNAALPQPEKTMLLGAFIGAFGHVGLQIDRLVGERHLQRNFEELQDLLEDMSKPKRKRRPCSLWKRCNYILTATNANNIEIGAQFKRRLIYFRDHIRERRNELSHSMTEIRGDALYIGNIGQAWNVTGEACRPNDRPPTRVPLTDMVREVLWLSDFLRDCSDMADLMHHADPQSGEIVDLALPRSPEPPPQAGD